MNCVQFKQLKIRKEGKFGDVNQKLVYKISSVQFGNGPVHPLMTMSYGGIQVIPFMRFVGALGLSTNVKPYVFQILVIP